MWVNASIIETLKKLKKRKLWKHFEQNFEHIKFTSSIAMSLSDHQFVTFWPSICHWIQAQIAHTLHPFKACKEILSLKILGRRRFWFTPNDPGINTASINFMNAWSTLNSVTVSRPQSFVYLLDNQSLHNMCAMQWIAG